MNAPAGREGLAEGLYLHENRLRTWSSAVKRAGAGSHNLISCRRQSLLLYGCGH
jgi:hypothetical protein